MIGAIRKSLKKRSFIQKLDDAFLLWYVGATRKNLGFRDRYDSPLVDWEIVERHHADLFRTNLDEIPGIETNAAGQLLEIQRLSEYLQRCEWPRTATANGRYYTDNGWFYEGDAVLTAAVIQHDRPTRIVEIGSGFSSAMMLDLFESKRDERTQLTLIEPRPQRLKELLKPGDERRVEILEQDVQTVPMSRFTELASGDILYIDSSHVFRTGGDLNYLFFDVFPRLAKGCLIHLHDIHWPFEYPYELIQQGYSWNEAYLLRAFLQYNRVFEIAIFGSHLQIRHREELLKLAPAMNAPTTSLWLRKVA